MAKKNHTKNKLAKNQPLLFLLCGILIWIGMIAGFYAKYTGQTSENKTPIAEEFYFTSNLLKKNNKNYTLASDTKQLVFELRNYEDELRSTPSDISYTYEVKKENKIVQQGTGTISATKNSGNKENITITNLSAGTYTVTARATSPFTKTLMATLKIPEENSGITYKISDSKQSAYVLLETSTNAYGGNIKISWPEGLIPDSTQEVFENVESYNKSYQAGSINISMEQYTSATYRFFKEDKDKDYSTTSDIKVEKVTN